MSVRKNLEAPTGRLWRTALVAGLLLAGSADASSHREAPFITEHPKVDGTDFYMFRSYEAGRAGFVTLVANYLPLQDPYGGPNYFSLSSDALYEIHIDNDGDAVEDLTFQFQFATQYKDVALNVGGTMVAIPLINAGAIGPTREDISNLNRLETYTVNVVRGDRRTGAAQAITQAQGGAATFRRPADYIGTKSIPQYGAYADDHVYAMNIPGCSTPGRVFVGQRQDPFVVNLGETFDLVNIANPIGARDAENNTIADKNVTSLILEVAIDCLKEGAEPVIGAWTTASVRQAQVLNPQPTLDAPAIRGGAYTQVSRLGMPLVNELIIGLTQKDRFNASEPKDDAQFATFVTNPTLPALLEILFGAAGVRAPTAFPRADLVAAFLTGVSELNRPAGVVGAEMLRLNTSIAAKPAAEQNSLGVLANDAAGFPNGRRPGDDVVDIELRVAMGVLLPEASAPSGQLPFTDGAILQAADFRQTFPYLNTPLPGSPDPDSTN